MRVNFCVKSRKVSLNRQDKGVFKIVYTAVRSEGFTTPTKKTVCSLIHAKSGMGLAALYQPAPVGCASVQQNEVQTNFALGMLMFRLNLYYFVNYYLDMLK